MIEASEPPYLMRGHRVHPFTTEVIENIAQRVCQILKLRRRSFTPKQIGATIHALEHHGEIHVDVISNDEWLDCTKATVDPQAGMIYMPDKLHTELMRGKSEAIRIFLHELGHVFLCHKPLLHFSEKPPHETEDSEWQADYFADAVMKYLHIPLKEEKQLELKLF